MVRQGLIYHCAVESSNKKPGFPLGTKDRREKQNPAACVLPRNKTSVIL